MSKTVARLALFDKRKGSNLGSPDFRGMLEVGEDLPAGKYTVSLWYEPANTESGRVLKGPVILVEIT